MTSGVWQVTWLSGVLTVGVDPYLSFLSLQGIFRLAVGVFECISPMGSEKSLGVWGIEL